MATIRFYLDTRAVKTDQPAPLKIAITHKRETTFIQFNVQLLRKQWDNKASKVINHPQKQYLNTYLTQRKLEVEMAVLRLSTEENACKMRAKDIKEIILHGEEEINRANLFSNRFKRYAESKKASTKDIYMQTYRRMTAFDKKLEERTFEEIDNEWLSSFDNFLSRTAKSKNARNVHLRNIRTVFNTAIDDNVTTFYPFRRFKIQPVATPKRSLSVEELRELFRMQLEEHMIKGSPDKLGGLSI